jgi:hypothetical protein
MVTATFIVFSSVMGWKMAEARVPFIYALVVCCLLGIVRGLLLMLGV